MKRNSEVVQDDEGKRIVVIHNIQFKGRQNIDWDSVENYIRRYIGQLWTQGISYIWGRI